LAIFIPTFIKRLRTNKLDEASEILAEMSRGARAYYESHGRDCLPPAAGPTPSAPSADPVAVEFAATNTAGSETWNALGVAPSRPLRFSYEYAPAQSGCGLSSLDEPVEVVFRARGDLDGDAVFSTFERRATVDRSGFHEADVLRVHQRIE
jgi:hypothetical protein